MISFTRVNLFFENKFLNFKICTAYFRKKFLKFEIRTGRRKFILHIADSLHPGSKVDFKHSVSLFSKLRKVPQKSYLTTDKSALRQSLFNIGMYFFNATDNGFNLGDHDDDVDGDDDYHDVLTRSLLCLEFRLFSLLDRALHHDVFSCPEQLDTDDR